MTCQGFKPDSGNPTVRHYRGASRNVRHGETVTPPAIERAGPETPHLQRGALDLYPNPSLVIGAADKAECLAGCKSPYRQLPVFGRLAYLERAEATKHDKPRRRSPSCPAAVLAAVGTIRGASKLGGRNITEYLQPRNRGLREVVIRRTDAGSRPVNHLGKADDTVEETGESTRCTAGVGDPASKERFSEITSGSCRGQQGLVTTCKDSANEAKCRRRRERNGSGE